MAWRTRSLWIVNRKTGGENSSPASKPFWRHVLTGEQIPPMMKPSKDHAHRCIPCPHDVSRWGQAGCSDAGGPWLAAPEIRFCFPLNSSTKRTVFWIRVTHSPPSSLLLPIFGISSGQWCVIVWTRPNPLVLWCRAVAGAASAACLRFHVGAASAELCLVVGRCGFFSSVDAHVEVVHNVY